jgi:hypothetical protein
MNDIPHDLLIVGFSQHEDRSLRADNCGVQLMPVANKTGTFYELRIETDHGFVSCIVPAAGLRCSFCWPPQSDE